MTMATILCDVREELRQGREPFAKIMSAVATLGVDDVLELMATFQPTPLFKVMSLRGFQHHAEQTPDGDWKVRFYRESSQDQR
jgi:uncharacterized protein (DUF2249 family)